MSLFQLLGKALGIYIEATRRTSQLKQILKDKFPSSVKLEQSPPQAVPENLWGDKWRLATFKAGDFLDYFSDRPIPIKDLPEELNPIDLGIASDIKIPGLVIYGGRQSMCVVPCVVPCVAPCVVPPLLCWHYFLFFREVNHFPAVRFLVLLPVLFLVLFLFWTD